MADGLSAQTVTVIDNKGTMHQVDPTDDQDATEVPLSPQLDIDGDGTNEVSLQEAIEKLNAGTGSGGITLGTVTLGQPNGALLSGSGLLQLSAADATNPGIVTIADQFFSGIKTFNSSTTIFGEENSDIFLKGRVNSSGVGTDLYIQASSGAAGSGDIIFQTGASSSVGGTLLPVINNVESTSFGGGLPSFSFGYTVPTGLSDDVLFLALNMENSTATASSVTFNGSAMTRLQRVQGNNSSIEVWYFSNPASGAGTIQVSSGFQAFAATTLTLSNTDQTTPFGTAATANAFGASVSVSPSSAIDQMIIDFISGNTGSFSATGGQSTISTGFSTGSNNGSLGTRAASAGSTTVGYSFSGANYAYMAFGVNGVPDTGGGSSGMTNAMVIESSGNVGIGTSTPSASLDLEGTLQLNDGTQSPGRVLTSDASGNASWQDLPSIALNEVLTNGNSASGNAIADLSDPSNAQDAATKNYVDTRQLGDLADVDVTGVVPEDGWQLKYVSGDWIPTMKKILRSSALQIRPTGSTSAITKISESINFQRTGSYSLLVSFAYSTNDQQNEDFIAYLRFDGGNVANIANGEMLREEVKDVAGNDGDGRNTDQKKLVTMKYFVNVTSPGLKTIELSFESTENDDLAAMWDAQITIEEEFNITGG